MPAGRRRIRRTCQLLWTCVRGATLQLKCGRTRGTIDIRETDNYEQWRQALGTDSATTVAQVRIEDGFEIELVRTARSNEGSWVSMAFDADGRLTVARESKGLLRFDLNRSQPPQSHKQYPAGMSRIGVRGQ